MATTVFPQTDDFGDPVLGQSMAAVINRGTEDPLSAFVDTTQDSIRFQYYGSTTNRKSSSTSGFQSIFDVDVDEGEAWYYEGYFTISEEDNADPGDEFGLRITPPAGVNVRGIIFGPDNGTPTSVRHDAISALGAAHTVSVSQRTGAENLLVKALCSFFFTIIGDTAGGNVDFEIVKLFDTHANNFEVDERFLIGHRIM